MRTASWLSSPYGAGWFTGAFRPCTRTQACADPPIRNAGWEPWAALGHPPLGGCTPKTPQGNGGRVSVAGNVKNCAPACCEAQTAGSYCRLVRGDVGEQEQREYVPSGNHRGPGARFIGGWTSGHRPRQADGATRSVRPERFGRLTDRSFGTAPLAEWRPQDVVSKPTVGDPTAVPRESRSRAQRMIAGEHA
jgi:hypothetical protein